VCDVTAVARALVAVGTLLVLMIGGFALAVYVTRDEDNVAVDNLLSENVTRAIALAERDSGGEVDLTRLARFRWDEVLLVARGTPRSAISDRLGYEWTGLREFGAGELLIFLDGGDVARFADYRGEGRFEGFETPIATVPRADAVLRVRDLVVTPD
jgi:hypothetical protein